MALDNFEAISHKTYFKELPVICENKTAYYNVEHDNFYCNKCNRGMGMDYYRDNIAKVLHGETAWCYQI